MTVNGTCYPPVLRSKAGSDTHSSAKPGLHRPAQLCAVTAGARRNASPLIDRCSERAPVSGFLRFSALIEPCRQGQFRPVRWAPRGIVWAFFASSLPDHGNRAGVLRSFSSGEPYKSPVLGLRPPARPVFPPIDGSSWLSLGCYLRGRGRCFRLIPMPPDAKRRPTPNADLGSRPAQSGCPWQRYAPIRAVLGRAGGLAGLVGQAWRDWNLSLIHISEPTRPY